MAALGCGPRERHDATAAPEDAASSSPSKERITSGRADTLDQLFHLFTAQGSECERVPEEPNVIICDRTRKDQMTLVLVHQDPRIFLISHFLRAPEAECPEAAPKLNEINENFDNLTLICAKNLTFRSMITLGEAGLTATEIQRYVADFRRDVQSIILANALKGIAQE